MLRERRTAVALVHDLFVPTERHLETTAMAAASLVATMIEQRQAANLPIETGADELVMISEGAMYAVKAFASFAKAHQGMRKIPASIGVPLGFGDDACPPNSPYTGVTGVLHSVA